MLNRRSADPEEKPAEFAVLNAVVNAAALHLERWREEASGQTEPVLMQVDGPGRTAFLDLLEVKLDPACAPNAAAQDPEAPGGDVKARWRFRRDRRSHAYQLHGWTAIRFDAWQHQRVAPPWWWLMSALDTQLRARLRRIGFWPFVRQRCDDYGRRVFHILKDLFWVLPGVALALLAWNQWQLDMLEPLKWLITGAGGIAATLALITALSNALRRHLLAESPRGTTALLRSTDPMEDLLRRYAFLLRSARGPVIVLVDNLDRCHAAYVVEMLEGIQTLLRHPRTARRWTLRTRSEEPCPPIAFVVAADRDWLCDSYLQVYKEFGTSAQQPGRPFGLVFVDKIFDVSLRIPTVPPPLPGSARASAASNGSGRSADYDEPFNDCSTELEVRRALRRAELALDRQARDTNGVPRPVPALRIAAVDRLVMIELGAGANGVPRPRRQCLQTACVLDGLLAELAPGPVVQRQIDSAYCVARTTQLLASHEVDDDDDAIARLALWAILELRWPLLAAHLKSHADEISDFQNGRTPRDEELAAVLDDRVAHDLVMGVGDVRLCEADVERFTQPMKQPRRAREADEIGVVSAVS